MYNIRSLLLSGLNVMPVKDKVPLRKGWNKYIFTFNDFKVNYNQVGLITGGTIEVIDIDNKSNLTDKILVDMLHIPSVVHKTGRNGYHLIYRCNKIEGNKKLARMYNGDTIIETRGNNGYIVIPPSKNYEIIRGELYNIPLITEKQRYELFEIAKSYNTYIAPSIPAYNHEEPQDYEAAYYALLRAGWVDVGKNRLRRPNKTHGSSATWGYVPRPYVLYVFSSSAAPFESNRAYTPSQILALLGAK